MSDLLNDLSAGLADLYAIERLLGQGGMATVYLARDLRHDRPVALKVLRPELSQSLGPERFQREIRLAARLQHPHILPVHDSGSVVGHHWYTMPYVEGESLRDRLRREAQLPLEDALRIAAEVADALAYAHAHGVVHRDIKPENIMLSGYGRNSAGSESPGRWHALVADFGIARALEGSDTGLTESGVSVGTPAYMSPEQSLADPRLDGRSDIYSLACVLYEMLVGEPPYTGPTAQAIIAKRLHDPVPSARRLRETVPPQVDDALQRAMAKAPADRYQTAGAFAAALSVPSGGQQPPSISYPTSPVPASRPARPRSRRVLAVAAGGMLAIAAAAVLIWGRTRGGTAEPLDADVVAVAPFEALDPSLALWHEGLVDALSRSLDGAGPLRTVSPTTVIRRWSGRADRESAGRLGRRTGAGLVLYGSIASAGRDSVRLRASLLDVAGGAVLGEQDVRGRTDHVDQLADSVAVAALRAVGQSRPIGAARLGGLGSHSLPALKAFLVGEQAFRRAQWDSAAGAYGQALALDSSFALAMRRLSVVRGWRAGVNDSLSLALEMKAGERNHGLPPRDSLLLVADSIMGTLEEGGTPDSSGVARIARLLLTAEAATQRYPKDPEAWIALGEARQHEGYGMGVDAEMTLAAFARAIALDSSFAPAYIHCVSLAFNLGDTAAAHRYARRFLALGPAPDDRIPIQVVDALLERGLRGDGVRQLLDTLSGDALVSTWIELSTARDSTEITVELARRFVAKPVSLDAWYSDSSGRAGMFAATLAYRGHIREALHVFSRLKDFDTYPAFAELALAGAIPADSVAKVYRARLRREPFWPAGTIVLAPAWWTLHGDTAALRQYVDRIDWRARSATPPSGATTNPYWARAGKAYLRLARGDSSAALHDFQSLPPAVGVVYLDRLTLARLLAAQGRDAEALAVLDKGFPWPRSSLSVVFWELERGRLAEKLGRAPQAANAYRYVVDAWRNADPELGPYVDEARAGLSRLGGESAGVRPGS